MHWIVFLASLQVGVGPTSSTPAPAVAEQRLVDARDAAQRRLDDARGAQLWWRAGIGAAIGTIAMSGVIGAVTHEPIETTIRPQNPELANALAPATIVGITAGTGFVVGLGLAIAAAATDETAATEAALTRAQRRLDLMARR